ncbi:hypothetical protein [Streptomyces sp. NBC_01243]|uniref:hypothetical protein n=1 Tax=Streptomyces sp. NBC_01243 TaxID=2903796 RepID=UPI002E10E4D9|nr:hypothetical protein OG348_42585 [Streptomyces sp. NBC_01243]
MMMWNNRADFIAGPVTIPAAQWTTGTLYDHATRTDASGWGAAVELPVVLQLLDLIAEGTITPKQAKNAFAPVLADLKVYDQEVAELEARMDAS